jgi:ankyrin repeat protein
MEHLSPDDVIGLQLGDNLGRTPLHYAARDDWVEGFQCILETTLSKLGNGVIELLQSKDLSGMSPIMWAAVNGSVHVFQYLIEFTIDGKYIYRDLIKEDRVEVTGRTVMHWAANESQKEIVEMLLESGIFNNLNIDTPAFEPPVSPLYYAIKNGKSDITRLLIAKGANPRFKSKKTKLQEPMSLATTEYVKKICVNNL